MEGPPLTGVRGARARRSGPWCVRRGWAACAGGCWSPTLLRKFVGHGADRIHHVPQRQRTRLLLRGLLCGEQAGELHVLFLGQGWAVGVLARLVPGERSA